ncbi:MAG: TylF/MycF/NovP-related O-methyltransferase [Bacillota bacterium]|nr:TylF/MycF/NovP-related O-methyltransferase [Bacillota bacterium]
MFNAIVKSSDKEMSNREKFFQIFKESPIPEDELLANIGLYIKRQTLSRIFFMNELYQKIINIHGSIIEFGVRWGQNMALFENLRGIYEPYNYNRKIIGFDTFKGFPGVTDKDKKDKFKKGDFGVTNEYELYLEKVLDYHESESPIPHIKKHDIVKGDATVTLKKYLEENPETIVAFAYFDFDIYEPTKVCLELIRDHLVKGAVIGFDELNVHDYPGETLALKEVLGIKNFKINRSQLCPLQSYIILE